MTHPPSGPSNPPPPSGPGRDDQIFTAVDEILADLQTPARGGPFSLPPMPAVRPFAVRTPPFDLGRGVPYDVLPGRSS